MAENAVGKALEVYVSKTEQELLNGEPNVLGLSTDQNTIVFNNKVIGSGSGIRYKKIILSASSGWIRFAVANSGASVQPTVVFGIDRRYNISKDEHYIFASTLSHQKKGYITQLTGTYGSTGTHFIKKVRTAQHGSKDNPFYLDFYVDSTSTESYYVWILGNWDLLDLSVVDEQQDATDNITRYVEFETSNGFNLDNNSLQIFRDKILSGLTEATADIRDTTLISTSDATGETGKWYKRKATTFWNYIKAKLGTVGSLGIGTTTPTAMLEVNGGIKATDFIGNIPDTAVFSKELTAFNSLKSPRLRSLNSQIRNNLLSFNGSALTAEYTIDGGATWVDFGLTDTQKNQFVTDGWEHTNQLKAGNGDTTVAPQLKGVRLTYDFSAITNGSFYGNVSDAIITTNANDGTVMKVEVLDWKNNAWTEKGTYNLYSPDALPNAVYLGTLRFRRASTTTADQYKAIRFIFSYQGTSTTLTSIPFNIRSIKLFSNGVYSNELPNYARYGHLYSTDSVQNMILPNELYPNTHLSKNLGNNTKAFKVVYTRYVYAPTSYGLQLGSGAAARWQIDTSGHYVPITANKYNIGSASYPVNNVYANRLVGVADKAVADENGRDIANTYQRVATPIFGGVMALGDRRLITSSYVGEATADKVFFLIDVFKFAYYVEGTDSFQSVFANGANWRDYSNADGTPIVDKLYITPNGNVYAFYNGNIRPIKAESISATKEYTTEVISIDANFSVTCLSNNAIKTLPTDILNGVMYLKSNGAVKSTAIPLNLGTTSNYPIKYLNGTTWVDATIFVRVSSIAAQWFLTVSSDTPVSTEGLVLEGQITANFVEE